MSVHKLTAVVYVLLHLAGVTAHAAAPYPTKPIRLISAFAPGGGTDRVGRMIAPELTEAWGQPVVIDNRPGAGGSVGTEIAAHSPPDGYTLVVGSASTVSINPLVRKVGYDPLRDLATVVHMNTVPLVLVAHPSVPATSLKEFIAYARSTRPNYASSGEGTISHLAGELLKSMAKIDMVHVPYRGGGPAVINLVAGHVQAGFVNMLEAAPQISAGRLRALAVSTPARSSAFPAIPTVAEAGLPGFEAIQWSGILAPAGVARPIVAKWNSEVNRILSRADIREKLAAAGGDPVGGTPEAFAALLRQDIARWSKVVNAINLKVAR